MASLTSFGISFLFAAAFADRPITCAVVPVAVADDGQLKLIALLEHRLAQDPQIKLVERSAFNAILQEQQIQLALVPRGTEARHSLGQILRAEFVILIESVDIEGRSAVRLIIAETQLGLRLIVETYPWADGAVRKLVDDIAESLSRARRLSAGGIPTIVAVPPFECKDFSFEHNHLTYTYAALAERSLVRVPGVVVVELEEARAIADELHLSPGSKTVSRPLPLYFIGKYKTRGCGDTFCVSFELALRQGNAVLKTVSTTDLRAIQIAAQLDAQVGAMMEQWAGHGPSRVVSAQQEIQILNERAARFRRLGDGEEAMALIEASLLLDSRQMALHFDAVSGYGRLSNAYYDPTSGGDNFNRKATQGLNYHHAGLVHLEHILRSSDIKWLEMMNFMSEFWASARKIEQYSRLSEGNKQLCRALTLDKREMLLAILEDKARDGTLSDNMVNLLRHYLPVVYTDLEESLEQNYAIKYRAIRTVLQLGEAERWIVEIAKQGNSWPTRIDPAYDAFLDQLEALSGDAVRIAVGKLRRDLQETKDRELNRPRRAKRVTSPIAPETSGAVEVAFSKITPCLLREDGTCTAFRKRISGWLRCGEGTDVAYSLKSLFVMKDKGKLKKVFESSDRVFGFRSVCFDGRYVWAPVIRRTGPLVILLDPQTEKTWRFTTQDGLPPASRYIAAAPVIAGMAIVSGSFTGQGARRSWVGILKFDGKEGKSVDVIHYAKYQSDTAPSLLQPATEADVEFTPRFIVPLHEPNDPENRRFLINIGHEDGLLVDAAQRSVELMPHAFTRQLHTGVTCRNGFGYWVWPARGQNHSSTVWRVGFPAFQKTSMQKGLADEFGADILFAQGQIHAVGKSWWTADDVNGDFRKVATDVPGRTPYRRFCKSNHYGDVLLTSRDGVYKVRFRRNTEMGRPPLDED